VTQALRRVAEKHGRKITATGLVASLAGVVTLLTMIADLSAKLSMSQGNADGLRQIVEFQGRKIEALEKFTGYKKRTKAVPVPPPSVGLVRGLARGVGGLLGRLW
jgi:hypothetical protein